MLPREGACASLCGLRLLLPAFYILSCAFLGWCCLHRGPLSRYSFMILEKFPMPSFTNCVNALFGEMSVSTHFARSSATHLPSSERQLHLFSPTCAHALSAKSFIKCSGCYDNYECGAQCRIRNWSSSYTVAHLHSFNAMVIMWENN